MLLLSPSGPEDETLFLLLLMFPGGQTDECVCVHVRRSQRFEPRCYSTKGIYGDGGYCVLFVSQNTSEGNLN